MSLILTCPHCAFQVQAHAEHAGQHSHCPRCQAAFQLSHSLTSGVRHQQSAVTQSTAHAAPPAVNPNRQRLCQQAAEAYRQAREVDPLFSPHAELALDFGERLGEGGMGTVYRIRDQRLGRDAALKLLNDTGEDSGRAIERFLREARITAKLDHPSIPPVYEAGTTTQGQHYMLMRVIQGQTLMERISAFFAGERSRRELLSLLETLLKVSEAVAYAHSQGVVHRDLKPENIMVGRFGEVMLMDWGVARDLRESTDGFNSVGRSVLTEAQAASVGLTLAGAVLGTPGYMSPEQAGGESVDERSDVFALGAILTEILTLEPPVRGETALIRIVGTIEGRIESPRERRSDVPAELNSIAVRALKPDLDERTPSAEDFVEDLRAFLAGEEVPSHHYSFLQRGGRWAKRRAGWLMGCTALAVLSTVTVGLWGQLEREALARQLAEEQQRIAQLQLGQAEQQRSKAQEQADRARRVLRFFNEARDRVNRGAAESLIEDSVARGVEEARRSFDALMTGAKIFEEAGLSERQEALLKEAIERHPPAYQALFSLHLIEMKSAGDKRFRFTDSLKRLIEEAKKRGDENEFTLFAEANEATEAKDYKRALELYSGIDKYTSRFLWAFNNRGNVRDMLGEFDAAIEEYNKALEIDADFADAYLNRAVVLAKKGDSAGALRDYDKAIQLSPGYALAYNNRGVLQMNRGRQEKARKDFDKALKLKPRYATAYLNRGTLHATFGAPKKALADFEEALMIEPNLVKAVTNRATVLGELGEPEAALEGYKQALELDSEYYDAYYNRASLRAQRGDDKGAMADYQRCLKLQPRYLKALVARALLRAKLGQYEAALKDFEEALKVDPRSTLVFTKRADLRSQRGDVRGAIEDHTKALKINPAHGPSRFNRGVLRRQQGDRRGALEDLHEAVKAMPEDALCYCTRGAIRAEMGDTAEALKDFERALKLNPKEGQAWLNRGVLRMQAGQLKKSAEDFEQALRYRPNIPQASQLRPFINKQLGRASRY